NGTREHAGPRIAARQAAIVEVPDVVDRELVAVELRVRRPGDVGLPATVVARPDRAPPDHERRRREREGTSTPPERSDEQQDPDRQNAHATGRTVAALR